MKKKVFAVSWGSGKRQIETKKSEVIKVVSALLSDGQEKVTVRILEEQ